jgi:murein L,D-transpeptidase YcbB/YkuD
MWLLAGAALFFAGTAAVPQTPLRAALSEAAFDNGLDLPLDNTDPRPAALDYGRAQHGGRIAVSEIPRDWAIRPARYDAAAAFDAAQASGRELAWVQEQAPSDARYHALVRGLARYRALAALGGWSPLALGPPLRLGAAGSNVVALRQRLTLEDPRVDAASEIYNDDLMDAVTRAQTRYGLTADGVAGPKTIAALNVSTAQRVEQILANLERWRWMPRALPARRVEVNTAAATLAVYLDDRVAAAMRIIPGKPRTPTPMFVDSISAVTFNPPWNVPQKIADEELWPIIRRNPHYMRDQGFVVMPNGALRQSPGPRAALGAFKFEMGNPFSVYLHDTPNRSYFAWDWRLLSHGCMRVENPRLLADILLAEDVVWTRSTIEAALQTGVTIKAPLKQPMPLFVAYWTAFADADGQMNFRGDDYGWDAALMELLAKSARR